MNNSKVMKAIIAILLIVLIVLYFMAGCGMAEESESRFQVSANRGMYSVYRIVDMETGVQYLTVNNGGTCVIVDKDGNPYLANGWRDYE